MTVQPHVGDGRHIGYCTRCGADVFNGPRHRCPKAIDRRAFDLIVAAKQFAEAEQAYRASTFGTLLRLRLNNDRTTRFDMLVRLIDEHNATSTISPETIAARVRAESDRPC